MDISSVIGRAALDATLVRSRISKIEAKIFSSESPLGGVLNTETLVGLSAPAKDDTNEHMASVSLKIVGYPKGTTAENERNAQPIFSINVVGQGTYRLGERLPKDLEQDKDLAYLLGRPVYAVVASELRAVAVKMGFPGVKPDPDLPKPSEGEDAKLSTKERAMLKGIDMPEGNVRQKALPAPKAKPPKKAAPKPAVRKR